MSSNIVFGGIEVRPGERTFIDLPLPSLYSHTPVYLPINVVNGKRPGPVLFVCAAIHGDEINGVEIIRRLLNYKQIQSLKGTLIAVPVVNVYGFISQSRYLPDRRDLNRSFPGSQKGSMASRLADTFMKEIVTQCTHGIDLHTGAIGRENLPQIRAKVAGDKIQTRDMACAFGAPVIINSELRDGSLREAVAEHDIPVLLYEAGEALRFDEVSIRAGFKGIIGVMRHLGMLGKSRRKTPAAQPAIVKSTKWVRAPQSGILRAIAPLGTEIAKGDVIGWVADPFGNSEEEVCSPINGIVISKTNLPLVHEGEALFNIACLHEADDAAESVELFQDRHDPVNDLPSNEEPVIV